MSPASSVACTECVCLGNNGDKKLNPDILGSKKKTTYTTNDKGEITVATIPVSRWTV